MVQCVVSTVEWENRGKKISWEKIKETRICGTQTIHVSHTYTKYTQSV